MRALFAVVALLVCGLASAATCNVTEFQERPPVTYQAAIQPALAFSTVTYTTTSVQSPQFQPGTSLVRIQCDEVAFIIFAQNPTATTGSMRLPAGVIEYFTIVPGNQPPYTILRLAVIGE